MRRRTLTVGLAAICLGLVLPAAASTSGAGPASSAITEWWEGSWVTTTGLLHFTQTNNKITARYTSGPGCIGRVTAEAEGPVGERLVGRFDDHCNGGDTGKLQATVNIDATPLTFRGRFCEDITRIGPCGSWITWRGTHRK